MPPTTPILDQFNRANENPLSGGGNWAQGWANPLQLLDNQIRPSSNNSDNTSYWTPTGALGDSEVYVTHLVDGAYTGVVIRWSNPGASADGYQYDAWDTTLYLSRIDNGVGTEIDTYSHAMLNGEKYWLTAIGDDIVGYVYTGGSWVEACRIVDETYATGYIGAWAYWDSSYLDDFGGGALSSAVATMLERHFPRGIGRGIMRGSL